MPSSEDGGHGEFSFSPEKYRVLPRGIYKARFVEFREGQGKWAVVYILTFEIVSGSFRLCKVNDLINKTATNKRGKLWRMVKALTNVEYAVSQRGKLSELINKECWIDVEQHGKNNQIADYISLADIPNIE